MFITRWINIIGVCSGRWSTGWTTSWDSWGRPCPAPSPILHQKHEHSEFWGHRHFPVTKTRTELVTESLGNLPRRLLGHKADFPSGFPGVVRASERLSAWKWGSSWVSRNKSPWPRLRSQEELKTEWFWVMNQPPERRCLALPWKAKGVVSDRREYKWTSHLAQGASQIYMGAGLILIYVPSHPISVPVEQNGMSSNTFTLTLNANGLYAIVIPKSLI